MATVSTRDILRMLQSVPVIDMQRDYTSRVLEVLKAYERQNTLVEALAKQLVDRSKLSQIIETSLSLDKVRENFASAAALPTIRSSLAVSAEATRTISAALAGLGSYDRLIERLAQSDRWIVSLDALSKVSISAQLNQRLGVILQSNLLAEQAIARVAARTLSIPRQLGQTLLRMATSHRDLWRSPWADIETLSATPRVAVEATGIDYYLAAHQVDLIPADSEVHPPDESLLGELFARTTDIRKLIASVGSDLLSLYEGAVEAVESRNPDRIRHASASLRELFTHILHRLAPDSDVLDWNSEGSLLDEKGRPTRRARLLYISRHVNQGDFAVFIEADLKAALVFLDVVQKGTHGVAPGFTDAQLEALIARMESLLYVLISLAVDAP